MSDRFGTDRTATDKGKIPPKTTSMLGSTQTADAEVVVTRPDTVDLGGIRPWRVAFLITQVQVELIITLTSSLSVGRSDPKSDVVPNVDLKPFGAEQLGVSRRHLSIRLDGEGVMVEDLHSVNGTRLNGVRLDPGRGHVVRHGDLLLLGGMELQVQLLLNPLE
ncbi:MAG: FHA domain-containing protein [Anaerolineae bacterium]|nr:FHA domain-containing protein [Anaerolineae bacterium]